MTAEEIYKELESLGDPRTKATLMRHGAKEPFFGVKVEFLKKILKKTKKNYELSLELYKTGNSDAMYLAALMADEKKMTKSDLQNWVEKAYWTYLFDYAVPWVAAETPYGMELGLEWIDSKEPTIAAAGWGTLSSLAGVQEDKNLDLAKYDDLLDRVEKEIKNAPNDVKSAMNNFIICVGCFVLPLSDKANEIGKKLGKLDIDVGDTNCKIPFAPDYIKKAENAGKIGKKRKSARC